MLALKIVECRIYRSAAGREIDVKRDITENGQHFSVTCCGGKETVRLSNENGVIKEYDTYLHDVTDASKADEFIQKLNAEAQTGSIRAAESKYKNMTPD